MDEATVKAAADKEAALAGNAVAASDANVATVEPEVPARLHQPAPAPFPLGWVIFGNVIILLVGGGTILFAMNSNAKQMVGMIIAKLNPKLLLKRKQAEELNLEASSMSAADEPMNMPKKPAKAKSGDDILDLSLPDD